MKRPTVDDSLGKLLEAQAALLTLAKREEELNACKLLLHAAAQREADLRAKLVLTEERLERARYQREEAWGWLDDLAGKMLERARAITEPAEPLGAASL